MNNQAPETVNLDESTYVTWQIGRGANRREDVFYGEVWYRPHVLSQLVGRSHQHVATVLVAPSPCRRPSASSTTGPRNSHEN